ncbi:5697_t:CDS:2 [Ambispora gerdemannii]|uniref:RBR-type E3 ubiquitin transferase n=1 Tax=Ambispora gerdemannii TaxID=144530 RepID=A0A9N8V0A8_9GLOM|nr:5697_t:CDS:2 [Ambispora gerdemannii]
MNILAFYLHHLQLATTLPPPVQSASKDNTPPPISFASNPPLIDLSSNPSPSVINNNNTVTDNGKEKEDLNESLDRIFSSLSPSHLGSNVPPPSSSVINNSSTVTDNGKKKENLDEYSRILFPPPPPPLIDLGRNVLPPSPPVINNNSTVTDNSKKENDKYLFYPFVNSNNAKSNDATEENTKSNFDINNNTNKNLEDNDSFSLRDFPLSPIINNNKQKFDSQSFSLDTTSRNQALNNQDQKHKQLTFNSRYSSPRSTKKHTFPISSRSTTIVPPPLLSSPPISPSLLSPPPISPRSTTIVLPQRSFTNPYLSVQSSSSSSPSQNSILASSPQNSISFLPSRNPTLTSSSQSPNSVSSWINSALASYPLSPILPLPSRSTTSASSPRKKECIICTETFDMTQLIQISINCQHENNICQECVARHIEHELQDKGNIEIRCLNENCRSVMTEDYVKKSSSETIFERYQKLSLVSALSQMDEFYWCLNPNCDSGQIHYEGDAAPIMTCQSCSKKTCVMHSLPIPDGSLNCPQCTNITETFDNEEVITQASTAPQRISPLSSNNSHLLKETDIPLNESHVREKNSKKKSLLNLFKRSHGSKEKRNRETYTRQTRKQALKQREQKRQEDLQKATNRRREEKSKAYIDSRTKKCPKCNTNIEKSEGCDHMTCRAPRCGYEFCWLCFADYNAIRQNGNESHMPNCKYYG